MWTIIAVLAFATSCQVASAQVSDNQDVAEAIARQNHANDIVAADRVVDESEMKLREALARKDMNSARMLRTQIRRAKDAAAKVKKRDLDYYMDEARRVAIERSAKDADERRREREMAKARQDSLAQKQKAGPVFIENAVVSTNIIGLPELNFTVTNVADCAVEGFELEIKCRNSFDEPVLSMAGKDTVVASAGNRIPSGGESNASVQLSLHRITSKALVRITRVKLANGEVWIQAAEEAAKTPGAVFTATTPR
jgi:hypothetical protein